MMRISWLRGVAVLAAALLAIGPALAAQEQQQQQQPKYGVAEYNAYQAAVGEKNPQQRLRLLDDFVSKYPQSELMPYILRSYIETYSPLKDLPKLIEYSDKMFALGDKIDVPTRVNVAYLRANTYLQSFNDKDPNLTAQAQKARDSALAALALLPQWTKAEGQADEQLNAAKKTAATTFNHVAGFASYVLKDYPAAINYYKTAITTNPLDPLTYYRLALAYLQSQPPQHMDGFWALARSVSLKGPNEAQVRNYLRNQLQRYQTPTCPELLDAQLNELLALASASSERPANFTIPSAADLTKVRETMGEAFLPDLKAGGERARLVWLATCGLDFPEVGGKVIEVTTEGDTVILKVYAGATPEEMEAATTHNFLVKVKGQPEAARVEKDGPVRFSGTLVTYQPDPFVLTWDNAKVNAEDIPAAAPAKQPTKQPSKGPTKRPPKRPGM